MATQRGTPGDDELFGGDGNDVLRGGRGIDVVFGQDGDDLVVGGPDTDYIGGAEGDDRVIAGRGDDVAYVDSGLDTFRLGDGADIISYELYGFTDDAFSPDEDARTVVADFDPAEDQIQVTIDESLSSNDFDLAPLLDSNEDGALTSADDLVFANRDDPEGGMVIGIDEAISVGLDQDFEGEVDLVLQGVDSLDLSQLSGADLLG